MKLSCWPKLVILEKKCKKDIHWYCRLAIKLKKKTRKNKKKIENIFWQVIKSGPIKLNLEWEWVGIYVLKYSLEFAWGCKIDVGINLRYLFRKKIQEKKSATSFSYSSYV